MMIRTMRYVLILAILVLCLLGSLIFEGLAEDAQHAEKTRQLRQTPQKKRLIMASIENRKASFASKNLKQTIALRGS